MKIAVATFTTKSDQYMMVNSIQSVAELQPDQYSILNTTKDKKEAKEYDKWLTEECKKYDLNLKLKYRKWDGNFAVARNEVIGMSTCDWTVMLDSDEMLTLEASHDLREKLKSLPKNVFALRLKKLDLLDDEHCLKENLWRDKRPGSGVHPQVIKTSQCRCVGKGTHEICAYPGRKEIPWNSPNHPKKDWRGYYLVHLWLYKDNPLRKWSKNKWEIKKRDMGEEYWKINTKQILQKRGWHKMKIPKDLASWVKITWTN